MLRQVGLLTALACGGLIVAGSARPRPVFEMKREAASDLEVTGVVNGIPAGESRFVSNKFLSDLPQVTVTIRDEVDFPGTAKDGLRMRGIYLHVLMRELGAKAAGAAIATICKDRYTASFPAEYLRTHRPILVLTVEGMTPHDWAVKNHQYDASPYFVAYQDFKPMFRVLSHTDQALQPAEIVKLDIESDETIFKAIVPKKTGVAKSDAQARNGYRIARQNCYRCHNAGGNGGTKAGRSWSDVGKIAREKPEQFALQVRDPKKVDPDSTMIPNPDYDDETVAALTKYFAAF